MKQLTCYASDDVVIFATAFRKRSANRKTTGSIITHESPQAESQSTI